MTTHNINLDVEMERLASLKKEYKTEIQPFVSQIEHLQGLIDEVALNFADRIKLQEDIIKNAVIINCESFKGEFGKVTFRRSYGRTSWDDKALMGYAVDHPGILQFRRESIVNATALIEVFEQA